MSRKHRTKHIHKNEKIEYIKRELDESEIILILIIYLILMEEASIQKFNNEYNEKNPGKEHKYIKKEFNKTVMLLAIIIYLTLTEESASLNSDKEDNEEGTSKEDKYSHKTCVARVTSETIPLSENIPKTPLVIQKPVIIKAPIVLAEPQVTIPILFTLTLDEGALEIKRIKKNVYLNKCKLLPNSQILFISGFIKKSVEYASTECIGKSELSGMIKNSTVKIPFNCTTKIEFITKPIFMSSVSEQQVELLSFYNEGFDSCEENIAGQSPCEQSFKFNEFFNEEIFCELVSSEIIETEIIEKSIEEHCEITKMPICCNITEKSVLYLTIKILQNQQILIC